jgi:TRAP-type uncharacterized transport system fused permease subunit
MLAAALTGFGLARMDALSRLVLLIASILMIVPSRTASLIGLALTVPIAILQMRAARAQTGPASS